MTRRLSIVNRRLILFIPLFLSFLIGCGGGGGGITVPTSSALTMNFQWTGPADPSGNRVNSAILALYDLSGGLKESRVLNRSAGTLSTFDSVAPGTYRVEVDLYSQADGNGSLLLEADRVLTVSGPLAQTVDVGAPLASVQVGPSDIQMETETSRQFYATGLSATGAIVPRSPSSFTYSVLGGIGQISSNNLFTAKSVGTGAVRATDSGSSIVGAATIEVKARNITTTEWTVLVYINGANDLYEYSDLNVDQMERVAGNPDTRFVLQWKQSRSLFPNSTFDGTRRVLVTPNTTAGVQSTVLQDMGGSIDMGVPQTLADFIDWGKANYPAKRYCVIVWNHGRGWKRSSDSAVRSVSEDWVTGNQIQIWELGTALAGKNIDVLAWDASLMQMMEVAYEVKDHVDFVAGSEESPPGEGYPYDLVFKNWEANPFDQTKSLTKGFVDGMTSYPPYNSRKITQSVLDTSKLSALATALSNLASACIADNASLQTILPNVRNLAQSYSPTGTRFYRDIKDVCDRLIADAATPTGVKSAAQSVITALAGAVVWEGHNSNSANSNGLSIDFSSGAKFGSYAGDYDQLKFAQDTQWNEFLVQAP